MTAAQVIEQIKALPAGDRAQVMEEAIRQLTPEERKPIERLLRRLQHPDIPENFWQGVEDHEDGRTVEMEAARMFPQAQALRARLAPERKDRQCKRN